MANDEHVALLKQGVKAWNAWRKKDPDVRPDLRGATLVGADLRGADLKRANLAGADLGKAKLEDANLSGAYLLATDLRGADLVVASIRGADLRVASLSGANLRAADLSGANLNPADLSEANLSRANLREANLSKANLIKANLIMATVDNTNFSNADLSGASLMAIDCVSDDERGIIFLSHLDRRIFDSDSNANLCGANLSNANLSNANLRGANLGGANLENATLLYTDLTGAHLTGCHVHGVSAWGLKLEGATQQNLVITPGDEPQITIDDIEVAQFIYLMLNNRKVRNVIDTITAKAVLILGRFTNERKAVLDALREELRKRDYVPILFDFEIPERRNITETVTLLARMARFIIADLTDPSSIPQGVASDYPFRSRTCSTIAA
jgi:uncharacterized protein YjbI with pentapeptide repeats